MMTIRSLLEKCARDTPDVVALCSCEQKEWRSRTYAEFLCDVRRTAAAYGSSFGLCPDVENVGVEV